MAQKNRKVRTKLRPQVAEILRRARKERSQWLFLDNQELTEVPEEVFDLTDLTGIALSGNRLKTIPERLWDLPKLRGVTLIGNPIESLPDRPGLTIDGPTYCRVRNQIDAKNIDLAIDAGTTQEDEDFWAAELRTARGLRGLTVGEQTLVIGVEHPKPGYAIRTILDSLADFDSLERLSLRGLRLEAVPEGIRQLRRLKILGSGRYRDERVTGLVRTVGP